MNMEVHVRNEYLPEPTIETEDEPLEPFTYFVSDELIRARTLGTVSLFTNFCRFSGLFLGMSLFSAIETVYVAHTLKPLNAKSLKFNESTMHLFNEELQFKSKLP